MKVSDLPNIGKPAKQALRCTGIKSLSDLRKFSHGEIAELHGVGPKAIGILKRAMTNLSVVFKRPQSKAK